jgi:2-methylisocitrate lyase-like PEP mutase family enzyme
LRRARAQVIAEFMTTSEKAQQFQALHNTAGAFVIPNPWDAGSARILAGLGFKSLATSSYAAALVLGRRDGEMMRDEVLAHARCIAEAVDLPVSADLEDGLADSPAGVAETIRLAAAAGLVGGSIEDATGDPARPFYDLSEATERIAAAAESARKLPFPFTLTARSENFVRGNPNLEDTIRRLQAFDAAGADVLFAPGLPDLAAVKAVCSAVNKPVNFMNGLAGKSFSVEVLVGAGVRRISLGGGLQRAALAGLLTAVREIVEKGSFTFADSLPTGAQIYQLMSR